MRGFALVDSVKVQDVFSMCEILHWIALLVREESVTAVVGFLRMLDEYLCRLVTSPR